MKTLLVKILSFIPFLIVILLVLNLVSIKDLTIYNIGFVSISITIATFSISFSLLQYQFSPYKALHRSMSRRQLIFSYLTIFTSLIPLFCLFYNLTYVPLAGLICIPILSYLIILLVVVANEETNPIILVKRKISTKKINQFIENFNLEDKKQIKEISELEFSKPDETPMHDYGETNFKLINIEENPFSLIYNSISITIQNNDIDKFVACLKMYFEAVDNIKKNKILEKYNLRNRIEKLLCISFEKICFQVCANAERKDFQNILVGTLCIYIKRKALTNEHNDITSRKFLSIICKNAETLLEYDNYDDALIIISTLRQICQKGLYNLPKDDLFFNHRLTLYPGLIKQIGQKAINLKNSDFLFRCLEEIGYLGCTAVKLDNHIIGVSCLDSLVQLGRESRANELKCFWSSCALEPVDHADERIWWMLSWILKVDEINHKGWLRSFETAYARLYGKAREIKMEHDNGKAIFDFTDSKDPYVERFLNGNYQGKIDYSNFKELKESRLY
jgi:hypothetical protein